MLPGTAEHLTALLGGKIGGDERSTAQTRLDDDGAQGQAADDAVARRKVAGLGLGTQGILADHCSPLRDLGGQAGVFAGIDHIHTTAQDSDGPPTSIQAGAVGDGVDPAGHAADHRHAGLGQAGAHHPRSLLAIDRGPARADNGHSPLVARLDPAPHVENGRRIVYLAEIGRIVGIIPGKDVHPGLCQPVHLGIEVQFVPHL